MTSAPIAALRQVWSRSAIEPRRRRATILEQALRGATLAVATGESVALLADNPAAADAVVMLLAGLAAPASGSVHLAGRDVTAVPAEKRGVAVVHRGLGLFERLTVAENAGFSGASPRAVAAMLNRCGLEGRAAMRPGALSGAERVRLAIARALLQRSPLLLLSDTLAGLDAGARGAACALVAMARAEREFAVVHASADAGAAFDGFGATRLAVLIAGAVVQEGVPRAVYEAPAAPAVARLTGSTNMLPGTVLDAMDGELVVGLGPGVSVLARAHEPDMDVGAPCLVCVRPERIALASGSVMQGARAEMGGGALAATVRQVAFARDRWRICLDVDGVEQPRELLVERPAGVPLGGLREGAAVAVAWQPHHAIAFRVDAPDRGIPDPGASGAPVAPSLAGSYLDFAAPTPDAPPCNLQDRPR